MQNDPRLRDQQQTDVRRPADEKRAAVARALVSLERGERNALEGLREAVCAFVEALRTNGASRDDALEAVRNVMTEPSGSGAEYSLLPAAREALIELSTHWCADQYPAD